MIGSRPYKKYRFNASVVHPRSHRFSGLPGGELRESIIIRFLFIFPVQTRLISIAGPMSNHTPMAATCPHCGFTSCDESPRFCSACGARMDGSPPGWYPAPGTPVPEQKSTTIAGFCSSVLPGLGQVYNGETAKGYILFLLAVAGLVFFLIPGVIVWLYSLYDAYAVSGKMNTGVMEVRPTSFLHMLIFILFAVAVVVIVVLAIVSLAMSYLMAQLGPDGTRFLQMMVQ
jgi:TM2 domain-containing membrane protein YozV